MPDWSRRGFLIKGGSLAAASVVAGFFGRRLLDGVGTVPVGVGTSLAPPTETATTLLPVERGKWASALRTSSMSRPPLMTRARRQY